MFRFADPFHEIDALRREIERVFDLRAPSGSPRHAFLPARFPRNYPLVNVHEDDDAITVEALAPGLNTETLQVTVHRNQLTLAGEKLAPADAPAQEHIHRSERAAGRFVRSFTLPAEIDEGNVSAEYKAGILKLRLPKAPSAKPRRIQIAVS